MNAWDSLLTSLPIDRALCDRLAVSLLHSLWQGALVAVAVLGLDRWLSRGIAARRYAIHLAGLLGLLLCVPATFAMLPSPTASAGGVSAESSPASPQSLVANASRELVADGESLPLTIVAEGSAEMNAAGPFAARTPAAPASADAIATAGWMQSLSALTAVLYGLGVIVMLGRLLVAMWGGHRLRCIAKPVDDLRWRSILQDQSRKLGLKFVPVLAWCERVSVPVVVGIVRPMILLPTAMATGLSPEQAAALLTHELAHIRRFDLPANLVQRLGESLLFFHPVVWWLSHRISAERENCCDDCVLQAGWERLDYADALVRIAEVCSSLRPMTGMPQAALLSATGDSPSQFKRRILRLLGSQDRLRPGLSRGGVLAAGAILLLVIAATPMVGGWLNPGENSSPDETVLLGVVPADEWPQWGGSPLRNNVTVGQRVPATWDVKTGQNVLWTAKLGTFSFGSPVVSGGRVFIGTNNAAALDPRHPAEKDLSCLACFDATSGKFLWQYASEKLPAGRTEDWPEIGLCSTPCVVGGRLWIVTNRGEVVCLDVDGFRDGDNEGPLRDEAARTEADADLIWKFDMRQELGVRPLYQAVSSITCVGDLLLLNTSNGPDESRQKIPAPNAPSFLALDRNTGRVVWSDNSPGANLLDAQCPGTSPAAAVLGGVPQAIFAGGDGWLYSFDLRDIRQGKSTLRWRFDCNPKISVWEVGRGDRGMLIATPVIHDGLVYIATGRNPEQGEGRGHLWCVDPTKRGDVSAELVFNESDPTRPIPHKAPLACETDKGDFTRPNPNSGVVWHYTSSDQNGDGNLAYEESLHRTIGSVAVHEGLLFLADLSGIVHCLDAKTGKVHWTDDLHAACWSTPCIADGKVFIGDEDGVVKVFKLSKQREVLGESQVNNSVYSTPAVANSTIYLSTKSQLLAVRQSTKVASIPSEPSPKQSPPGRAEQTAADRTVVTDADREEVSAIDPNTGLPLWKTRLGAAAGAVVVQGDRVYVGDSLGKFRCLSLANGELLWSFDAEGTISGGAAVFGDRVVFGTHADLLYCLHREAGGLLWKQSIGAQVHSTPVVLGPELVVAACDGKLHFHDVRTGRENSSIDTGSPTGSTPRVQAGRIYIANEGGEVLCLRWGSNDWLWRTQVAKDKPVRGFAALTENRLVVGTQNKEIVALDPGTGQILWTRPVRHAVNVAPEVHGSTVIAECDNGDIVLLDLGDGRLIRTIPYSGRKSSLIFSKEGQALLVAADGQIQPVNIAEKSRIVVKYDIPGSDEKARIYVQHINGKGDIGTEQFGLTKFNWLKNGGTLELYDLEPGEYQVARLRLVEIAKVGMSGIHSGMHLDRRLFKLKAGETVNIDLTRPKGQSVKGRVYGLKDAKIDKALVCICSPNAKDAESPDNLDVTIFDALSCDAKGTFQSDRLVPGTYKVVVLGYVPPTKEDLATTSPPYARYSGIAEFKVPESGQPPLVEVQLVDKEAKVEADAPAVRFSVLDHTGHKGIASFRIVPGTRPPKGDEPVWHPDRARLGKDGGLKWPLADIEEDLAFRIEADGRVPQVVDWVKKEDGIKHIVCLLPAAPAVDEPKKDEPKPEAKVSPRDRVVTLKLDVVPLDEALLELAQLANVKFELDGEALSAGGLTAKEPTTINVKDIRLEKSLEMLVKLFQKHQFAFAFEGDTLVVSTVTGLRQRLVRNLPEWLKPLHNNGVVATLDDERQVVVLSIGEIATDDLLAKVATLPRLRELDVGSTKSLTAAGLANLAKLPALESLNLWEVNREGAGLGNEALRVAAGIKTLRKLTVGECGVTDEGARVLEPLTQLTSLSLRGNRLTDAGVKSLAGLTNLRSLDLSSSSSTYGKMRISDAGLAHLVGLTSLEELHVAGLQITGRQIVFLKLKTLSLSGPLVDDAAMDAVAKCGDLRVLSLSYSRVTDEGLKRVAGLKELRRLSLDSRVVTDAGIAHLTSLAKLEHVELRATQICDAAIGHLAKIKSLTRLDLHGSGEPGVNYGRLFTIDKLKTLKDLPKLTTLWITNFESPGGYLGLEELQQLRSLVLHFTDIRKDDLDRLADALPNTHITAVSGSDTEIRSPRKR